MSDTMALRLNWLSFTVLSNGRVSKYAIGSRSRCSSGTYTGRTSSLFSLRRSVHFDVHLVPIDDADRRNP